MVSSYRAALERPRNSNPQRKTRKKLVDNEARYQKGYNRICAIAHQRTHNVCCVCLSRKSEQIHHAFYRKQGDVVGFNTFPVCERCHGDVCHNHRNWIKDKEDPTWGNKNTDDFIVMLRQNYKLLSQGVTNVER